MHKLILLTGFVLLAAGCQHDDVANATHPNPVAQTAATPVANVGSSPASAATDWAAEDNGDTDIGLALKHQDHDLAYKLLQSSGEDVARVNFAGEGHVYLAARAGYADIIREVANRRYNVLPLVSFFHFEDLDSPTSTGENAFFVAKNVDVLNELITQYYRGSKWYAGSYVRQINSSGQNFLHWAARDGRAPVATWANAYLCQPLGLTRDAWWPVKKGSELVSDAYGLLQTYTLVGRFELEGAMLFNRQDNAGQTPLHVAVAHQNWSAARALARCSWIDYDLADNKGDLAVHTLLKSLDPARAQYDDETHAFFRFLTLQNTRIRKILVQAPERMNTRNLLGESPMQLASKLKDPFFAKTLSEVAE